MSDTQEIITLRAWLETANTRITELEQENRYLDSLNYELQYLENRLIPRLKARIAVLEADLKAEGDEEHKRWCEATDWKVKCEQAEARIAELQAERDNLSRHLAAGAAWDSPDALLLENSYLKARIAELEKRI